MTVYKNGQKILRGDIMLSPPRLQHCGGDCPLHPRGSDTYALSCTLAYPHAPAKTPYAQITWLHTASLEILCTKSSCVCTCGKRGFLQPSACFLDRGSTISHQCPSGVLFLQGPRLLPKHVTAQCIEISSC